MQNFFYIVFFFFHYLIYSICGVPTLNCAEREVLNVPIMKCGDTCVYIPERNICAADCPKFNIRNFSTGACQLAICDQRVPDLYLLLFCFYLSFI
jgi:hypothetical protein